MQSTNDIIRDIFNESFNCALNLKRSDLYTIIDMFNTLSSRRPKEKQWINNISRIKILAGNNSCIVNKTIMYVLNGISNADCFDFDMIPDRFYEHVSLYYPNEMISFLNENMNKTTYLNQFENITLRGLLQLDS